MPVLRPYKHTNVQPAVALCLPGVLCLPPGETSKHGIAASLPGDSGESLSDFDHALIQSMHGFDYGKSLD